MGAKVNSKIEDGMGMDLAESYSQFARHYDLIYENWEAAIKRQAAALGAVLQRECGVASGARILDCACGIGTQALGLAAAGFRMSGCDVSSGAIERAREEARRRELDISFSVGNMVELSSLGDSGFAAVICMDNALPHLGAKELRQAAEQIQAKLGDGGVFMASIRNYDDLIAARPVGEGPFFYSDEGRRRIVFQIWDWIDDRRYVLHLYVTREVEKGWQTLHMGGLYRAVRKEEVTQVLSEAGFRKIRWLSEEESGF